MWELDYKESWVPKYWCVWTVVLEKTLESPLDCKEIKPVHPIGNQPWIFIGRTDAEAPIFWLPNVKSWLIGKDPDAGKDWRQEEKGTIEDEVVEWRHWLNGYEFEHTLGVGEGQESLVCCSPWCRKELDMTERLNSNNKSVIWKKKKKGVEDDLIFQLLGSEAYTFNMITKPWLYWIFVKSPDNKIKPGRVCYL